MLKLMLLLALSDPRTVATVDLQRYQGTWYEIGSIPQWFSRGCTGTTAEYGIQDDGTVRVRNSCRLGALEGPEIVANGTARAEDDTNAKLSVTFDGRDDAGDYWILALADDYSSVLVGGPERDALWILSRERTLPEATVEAYLDQAEADGFPVTEWQRTRQQ